MGGLWARKASICKEHLLRLVSVTSQAAISRRVHRYMLALRDRQATRGGRKEEGKLPMVWGWYIDADQGIRPGRNEGSEGLERCCVPRLSFEQANG